MSADAERARQDLVIANRILANEGVLDAYGHISARNPADPATFLLSRSRSPEHIELNDLMTLTLDGSLAVPGDDRAPYLERFIHGAIYEARPDVHCVIHGHTEAVLPFGITDVPLVPVIHSASEMGPHVPVWDIRTEFGNDTNLLVTNTEQGRSLARTLGDGAVVLMRGHGFAAGGSALSRVVALAVYLARNARVLTAARMMGEVTPLSPGEMAARAGKDGSAFAPGSPAMRRSWEYWAIRAGCADML